VRKILLLLSISTQFCIGQDPAIQIRSIVPENGNAILLLAQPATASRLKGISVAASTEKRFLLEGLNHSMAVIGLPLSFGGIGLTIDNSGSKEYNLGSIGLIYGKDLGKVDLGVSFNYTSIKLNGYGKASTIEFALGSLWQISEKIHTSILLKNPVGGKFGLDKSEKLPAAIRFGLGYKTSDNVSVAIELIKEEEQRAGFNAGLCYAFNKKFFFQAGIQTPITSPYWSVGYQIKKLRIETYCSYHQQLGFSPAISLIFLNADEE